MIGVEPDVETAVQAVVAEAVDIALHRAGLVAEGDKSFFIPFGSDTPKLASAWLVDRVYLVCAVTGSARFLVPSLAAGWDQEV